MPASPAVAAPWSPDVYSRAFVPAYLHAVNAQPAIICVSLSPPHINFHAFIAAFSGAALLRPLPPPRWPLPPSPPLPLPLARPASPARAPTLTPDSYAVHFFALLAREFDTQRQELRRYDLYNVPLAVQDPAQMLVRVQVPGLRENMPPVQLGDLVHLRKILPPYAYPGYPGGFTGYQYDTFVYGLDKTEGFIVLRADNLILEPGAGFNVCFVCQEKAWHGAARAIDDVDVELKRVCSAPANGALATLVLPGHDRTSSPATPSAGSSPAPLPAQSFLKRMLFPQKEDGVWQTGLSKGVFRRSWFDTDLNYEQQKCIDAVLEQNYGSIPFLLWGPPGTGKTKTIVEIALQLVFSPRYPKHHILLCAPSQEAADTLAIRLVRHLGPKALLRLQAPSRTFAEVSGALLPYCYIEGDMFSLPEWKVLMGYRVVVCSTKDAEILVEARCTNRDLGRWEKSITDSLRGIGEPSNDGTVLDKGDPVHCHWTALLVDEAAQGIEPEVAIGLSIVAPPEEVSNEKPIFVMAGDQKQLGPRLAFRNGPLEESLFERLFSRKIYAEHPLARSGFIDYGGDKERQDRSLERRRKLLPYLRPPFSNLVRNYRSHPAILAIPSVVSYYDTLLPEAQHTDALEVWNGWCGRKGVPVKFMLNSGLDESHEEGTSYYNISEIALAVDTVRSLLSASALDSSLDIKPSEIAVMSPFREQVKRLRTAFRAAGYRSVNVGPIESYQGAEYRLCIICTTRARQRFLDDDYATGKGLVFENRRTNVALTRAKHGVIVIGNPWILERDPFWRAWMSFCWRHDCIQPDAREQLRTATATITNNNNEEEQEEEDLLVDETKPPPPPPPPPLLASVAPQPPYLHPDTSPVNSWQPPKDDRETPQYISRLETALVFKTKAQNGDAFGAENRGWDEDDPMWTVGMAAEEALRRGVDDLSLAYDGE